MRYKQRVAFVFVGCWLLCSLVVLHWFGIVSVADVRSQPEAKVGRSYPTFGVHPGLGALRRWGNLVNEDAGAAKLSEQFLEEAIGNGSGTLDLDAVGGLWRRFLASLNASLDDEAESRTLPNVDELLGWARLMDKVQNAVRKTRDSRTDRDRDSPVIVEYEEYPEPSSRSLAPDVLETLLFVSSEMNKVRIPRRDLGEMLNVHEIPNNKTEDAIPVWRRFQNHMRRHQLYSSDDPDLEALLHNLRTLPIVGLTFLPNAGTQIKLLFRLKDGSRTLAKPKRMPIHIETPPERYQFDDFEKFYAEVASFHLDRIMGFNRVPPVVSRYINITSEVKYHAPREFRRTFYKSSTNDECFFGVCDQFCDSPFAVCGSPHLVAASFAFYLPSRNKADRLSWENPWKQSYSRYRKAEWQTDDAYCTRYVVSEEIFANSRRLLDIMDMAVFDFIQGNLDRHHYHTFEQFENDTNIFLYDNGRAFARSYRDDIGLLAPISQCCLLRLSTLDRLLALYTDETTLGGKLRRSLANETVRPLLTERHLRALDRRLVIVLETVYNCIAEAGGNYTDVVHDDGF